MYKYACTQVSSATQGGVVSLTNFNCYISPGSHKSSAESHATILKLPSNEFCSKTSAAYLDSILRQNYCFGQKQAKCLYFLANQHTNIRLSCEFLLLCGFQELLPMKCFTGHSVLRFHSKQAFMEAHFCNRIKKKCKR